MFVCNDRLPPAFLYVMSGCPELFWLPSKVVCTVKLPSTVAYTAGLPSAVVCTYCLTALSNVIYCLPQQTATKVHGQRLQQQWVMWFIHIFTCFHITWFFLLLCVHGVELMNESCLDVCACSYLISSVLGSDICSSTIILIVWVFSSVLFCWTNFYRTKTCIHFQAEDPVFFCVYFL